MRMKPRTTATRLTRLGVCADEVRAAKEALDAAAASSTIADLAGHAAAAALERARRRFVDAREMLIHVAIGSRE